MPELLIPILVFVTVIALGGAILAVAAVRREQLRTRLRVLASTSTAPQPVGGEELAKKFQRLATAMPVGQPSLKLQQRMAEAGLHGRDAAVVFLTIKMALLVLGLVVSAAAFWPLPLALAPKACLMFLLPGLLFFMPNVVVSLKRQARCHDVKMHLPDAVDLLEICVSAGMGLDMAWNAVSQEVRRVSPTLADEMALTSLEVLLGASRAAAMRHMADRTDSQDIRSLVGILVQSERFGTSVADALRQFARTMRENRSMTAQEAAEKMAVKLLFPMIVFIFPVVIIIAVGPAAITLVRTLGGQGQ